MNKYPTKETILQPMKLKREAIEALTEWKKIFYEGWSKKDIKARHIDLYALITYLSHIYNKPVCIAEGDFYCYNPQSNTIHFDPNNASIVSYLHEFAHHIFGSSEKQACRWSVHMFKRVFPKAYSKLTFNGHMLVKA